MKINPLYIGLLLVMALFFVIYQLDKSKNQLRESKVALHKIEAMAEEIDALKRTWDVPKSTTKAVNRLIKSSQLKTAKLQQTKKRGKVILKSKKANLKASNYFFVKLFNGAYILEKFEVKRLDEESVSFSVEIKT